MINDYNDFLFAYRRLSVSAHSVCVTYWVRWSGSRGAVTFYVVAEHVQPDVPFCAGSCSFVLPDSEEAWVADLPGLRVKVRCWQGLLPDRVERVRVDSDGMMYLSGSAS